MNDKELYKKCVLYGRQILKARRKFMGLLPEVFRRRLYQKKGFGSVQEFAAKLAGISREQVNRVLRLEERFAGWPILHSALVEGKISVNKLVRIAPIVTVENERDLFAKAEVLSSRALEVFVREVKNDQNLFGTGVNAVAIENKKGLDKPMNNTQTVHVHGLKLDEDVETELQLLHEKGFARNRCHDPRFMKPLCKVHHELAHVNDPWWVQKYRFLVVKCR